jgi:uncharacterized protein (DUF58 family)
MDWGEGQANKFYYALSLAAALGAIALSTGDQLTVRMLNGGPAGQLGPLRGRMNLLPLLRFLEKQAAAGAAGLAQGLRNYALQAHRPGLAILLSDLLTEEDVLAGLRPLRSHGNEITLLHLLSPDEIDPPLAGDLRLLDVESGSAQEVSLDAGMRSLYRRRLAAWQDQLQAACAGRGVRYLGLSTAVPWEKVVLQELRRQGLVK